MDELLLGLDIGTSHIKAVLSTPRGRVIASASTDYPTHYPQPGWAEQSPADWWQGVVEVTRQVTRQASGRVAAVGVSGQGCAVTLLDSAGQVIRPAIIWMDSRSEPQCERLRNCCLADLLAHNGKAPAPYNADPVLMWLAEHEPHALARAETSLTTTAYINYRLTGRRVINHSDASILLAYDLERKAWSQDLIREFNLPARLYPELAECDEVIGHLSRTAADELGLPEGIPVVAGGEDTSSAGLASGAVREGLVYLSLGTAGTVNVCTEKMVTHPQLLTFRHVLPDQFLLGGSMVAVGASLSWARSLLGGQMDYERLIALAGESEPGAGRLLFLPYLSGELQPINDGNARGMFFGLSLSTAPKDILRAVLEGTAFAIAHNLSLISSLGIPITEIRAVGGPTRSALWCQIISDISGSPLRVLAEGFGAPLGNALLAAKGAGLIANLAENALEAADFECAFEPDPRLAARYSALFDIYRQLYGQVKDQYVKLSQIDAERKDV